MNLSKKYIKYISDKAKDIFSPGADLGFSEGGG